MAPEDRLKDEMNLSILKMITTNNLEEQCAIIASWIKQYYNADGVGFFSLIPNQIEFFYTKTVPEDIFQGLEEVFAGVDQSKTAGNEVLFFGQKEGQV